MKIYEIDAAIESLIAGAVVDDETGEIEIDTDALEQLQLERKTKIENLALAYKNLTAEAKAIREEEKALAARRKTAENRAERAKKYLDFVLAGEKFATSRVSVTYKSTPFADVKPGFIAWAEHEAPAYLRQKDPEPDKVAILAALKSGDTIPFAELSNSVTMQIK